MSKKIFWYCTCVKGKHRKNDDRKGILRPVKVSAEETCLDCGYYAVASPTIIPDIRLYKRSSFKKEEKINKTSEELSKIHKKSIYRIANRKGNDKTRKNKNGNMDVQ